MEGRNAEKGRTAILTAFVPVQATGAENPDLFLVTFPPAGEFHRWLFIWTDPRTEGCNFPVLGGVGIEESTSGSDEWRLGIGEPHVLVRSKQSPSTFKICRSELDIPVSGWEILEGVAEVWSTWDAFKRPDA